LSVSIKTAENRYATKTLPWWAGHALLHRGYEQHCQNGERPWCDQNIPQWTV